MPEITKVAYGMTIGDLKFGNQRPGVVEATLRPGETLEEALDELDDRITAWHKKRYPSVYEQKEPWIPGHEFPDHMKTQIEFGPQQSTQVIDYKKIEQLEKDIDNAQTSEELEAVVKSVETFPGRLLGVINVRRQALKAKQ